MTIGVWVHFWVLNSIPLICLSVIVPVPCSFYHNCSIVQLEVREGDSKRSSFIVENSFGYPGFPCYPKWICKLLFLTLWRIELEFWWGLYWICRLLLVNNHFHYGNPTSPWVWKVFPYSEVFSISFFRDLKFLSYRSFTCLVTVSPRYFILFVTRWGFGSRLFFQPVYPLCRERPLIFLR